VCVSSTQAVDIETVPVGNPANAGELSGTGAGGTGPDRICGAVNGPYKIGKYEVTSSQYSAFLNAVARTTDTYGLYHQNMGGGCGIQRTGSAGDYDYWVSEGWEDRPVNYVSWGDAARFANWLHNGQPTGLQDLTTTEDGSYFVNGAETNSELMSVTREPDATYVIPSEDEWYKAAFHKNNGVTSDYWDYPTSSDTIDPSMANYNRSNGDTTDVGSFPYPSPYGTYDQGGNLWEWTEGVIDIRRVVRGGQAGSGIDAASLHAADRSSSSSEVNYETYGFRIAQVPEPSSLGLLSLGGLALLRRRG